MRLLRGLAFSVALILSLPAYADEGMWMVHDINAALEKNLRARGLKLQANQIYDADAPGASIADAVVSLGFHCTGSVISENGLVLTSLECARPFLSRLGSPSHDYLEEGFWAMTAEKEVPVEGEKAYFLRRVFDVTGELRELRLRKETGGREVDDDALASELENRYRESTGLTCILSSMWAGEKYYMSAYRVYDDVRLVAAPPASFGYSERESGRWSWPRHDCDFALYRIYENGRPVTWEKYLKVSLKGYSPGSFAMVIGYPGQTWRYSSSFGEGRQEDTVLPISDAMRSNRIRIIGKWMDVDPWIRKLYAGRYSEQVLAQKRGTGTAACLKKYKAREGKLSLESLMDAWSGSSAAVSDRWGRLLADIGDAYSGTAMVEKDKVLFRETILNGTFIAPYILRASASTTVQQAREVLLSGIIDTDPRVEKELLRYALEEYFTNLDSYYYGSWQRKVQDRFGYDYKAMADYLWENSLVNFRYEVESLDSLGQLAADPLVAFLLDAPEGVFDARDGHKARKNRTDGLEEEYQKALYWMKLQKGEPQYPDANNTMRLSFGKVGESYTNPQVSLPGKGKWGRWGFRIGADRHGMIADFLTDNDVTEGSQGSPVLDANGDIIGLAIDTDSESLAGDLYYAESCGKCVNTDIRFILWMLDRYAGMKRILKELEFT